MRRFPRDDPGLCEASPEEVARAVEHQAMRKSSAASRASSSPMAGNSPRSLKWWRPHAALCGAQTGGGIAFPPFLTPAQERPTNRRKAPLCGKDGFGLRFALGASTPKAYHESYPSFFRELYVWLSCSPLARLPCSLLLACLGSPVLRLAPLHPVDRFAWLRPFDSLERGRKIRNQSIRANITLPGQLLTTKRSASEVFVARRPLRGKKKQRARVARPTRLRDYATYATTPTTRPTRLRDYADYATTRTTATARLRDLRDCGD